MSFPGAAGMRLVRAGTRRAISSMPCRRKYDRRSLPGREQGVRTLYVLRTVAGRTTRTVHTVDCSTKETGRMDRMFIWEENPPRDFQSYFILFYAVIASSFSEL